MARLAVIVGKVGFPGKFQFMAGTVMSAEDARVLVSDRQANGVAFPEERVVRLPRRFDRRAAERLVLDGVYGPLDGPAYPPGWQEPQQPVYHQRNEDGMTDAEADADTLRSAGMGTDEDYGYYGEE